MKAAMPRTLLTAVCAALIGLAPAAAPVSYTHLRAHET